MKDLNIIQLIRNSVALVFAVLILQGCLAGKVFDTAGNAMPGVDVVSVSACTGEGCASNETEVVIGNELETGFRQVTNENGHYFFDPYGEAVPPEDAMWVHAPQGSADKTLKLAISKDGYQQVVLTHLPEYEMYTDPNTGKEYAIDGTRDIYLCRDDEVDSDGDTICDDAERQYGTSHANPDTDNDGINDNIELFQNASDPGDLQQCVFGYCRDDLFGSQDGTKVGCFNDPECTAWLNCMEGCGEDEMLCPTQCGAFYQSPQIDSMSQCALDNGCAFVEFPDLPACDLPQAPLQTVGNIDGFWWVTAINGNEFVLYDDCQRFIFDETATEIVVENSTLVTVNNSTETRVAINNGNFTRELEGYLTLVYDNWAGYSERYHPYHVTDNVMIMHVCSVGTDGECHDYGTLILSRSPLNELSAADSSAMDAALQNVFQETINDYSLLRTENCPNAPGIEL